MEVTNKMVHEAIKQAVKDKIIPIHGDDELYIHHWDSVRRMIEKALEYEGQEL